MPSESNFWKQIKNNLPKDCLANRIESKVGGGVPDVHLVLDGLPFWIELKTTKTNKVNITPHQIAWHMAYSAKKGKSFYLVKHLPTKHLFLFEGHHGSELLRLGWGVYDNNIGSRFEDLASLFDALRADLRLYFASLLE